MKLNLVKDANGKVVAKPVLPHGHKTHEVDVPANYKSDIKALYQNHSR